MSELLSTHEAAELLDVNLATIYKWSDDGTLPFTRVGKKRKYSWDDVQKVANRNDNRVKDFTGTRTGKLVAVEKLEGRDCNGANYWRCKCDCGNFTTISSILFCPDRQTNERGKPIERSCGCHVQQSGYKSAMKNVINSCRRCAKFRGYSYNLTHDQHYSLISSPCNYCGKEASTDGAHLSKTRNTWGFPNVNGVDRVDNSKGYEIDNVVSCCKVCNYMKLTMMQEDFLEHIERIHNCVVSKQNSIKTNLELSTMLACSV